MKYNDVIKDEWRDKVLGLEVGDQIKTLTIVKVGLRQTSIPKNTILTFKDSRDTRGASIIIFTNNDKEYEITTTQIIEESDKFEIL